MSHETRRSPHPMPVRLLLAALAVACLTPAHAAGPSVIPLPASVKSLPGELSLPAECLVATDADVELAPILDVLNAAGRVKCSAAAPGASAAITFRRVAAPAGASEEAYRLAIAPGGASVTGDRAGLYYGAQTLARLMENAPVSTTGATLAAAVIDDTPRFAWRGYMLDESRHFSGEAAVKRTLDLMARYKLNRFHWHLTDSPGWRIEIKKYPLLTAVGGRGDQTTPPEKSHALFYTQEQIRDIVAYARDRHITVIPEIDMPGHADAAVRAYPEHAGGKTGKSARFTFNPAKPATRAFLDDILAEVAALFPDAKVIHFGGDEVHFGWKEWPELPEVRDLMARENLKDNAAVEARFNRQTAATIRSLGFVAGGWDEIVNAGLPPSDSLVFWWRHDKPAVLENALAKGYPVVLCPRIPLYFDFIQSPTHKTGRTWGKAYAPIDLVYAFPSGLDIAPGRAAQILGIQACLWTEAARTQARRDFLTRPRLAALAEAAWTPAPRKDFADFSERLRAELPRLRSGALAVYDPFADTPEVTDKEPAKQSYIDNPE